MKTLRGRDGLLLYLDFDGVLHHEDVRWHPRRGVYMAAPEPFRLFEHVDLLERLLAPHPTVQVVLSTSWVRVLGYSRALKHLPPRLRERVIGATYHSAMNQAAYAMLPRGVQILDDVERRQPSDWLALDDDGAGWPTPQRQHLVLTDERLGLGGRDTAAEVAARLGTLCRGKS